MRAVILSVDYGDLLAVVLPAWKAILPTACLSVATTAEDAETRAVCARVGVPTIVTDAWTRSDPSVHVDGNPTFNMALGLDVSLGLTEGLVPRPSVGELLVHINADCYPTGVFPREPDLDPGVLYGVWRYGCSTPADLAAFRAGRRTFESFGHRQKNNGGRPVGYFQMWRYENGLRYGSYATAGKFDTHFCTRWMETPGHRMEMRDDVKLLHLGDQVEWANWAGRVVPRWEGVPA